MAGKEIKKQAFSSPLLKSREMEQDNSRDAPQATPCWRKQVDDNLKRLHSLCFGADHFLQKRDYSSARLLSLQLLGFLESQSLSEDDEVLTRPIHRDAVAKLDGGSARPRSRLRSDCTSMLNASFRYIICTCQFFMLMMCLQCTLSRAFEQAGRVPGRAFSLKGDIDVEKIKQSKYFRVNVQRYNERATSELVGNTKTFSLSLI
ncbi:hypothetical protein Patl1_03019 [Pistacia atlantica]|uniref:Uncharacterized protein n=1 Tax=Pistacia atlantica TaxID=434234 RepID=A0ACC1C6F1_9ROSI|nr:hypothetical protein Patl1_03019 [Pistacia atlantica]